MEHFREGPRGGDISSLGKSPSYLTTMGRRKSREEEEYVERVQGLFEKAKKRHPGYKVRMTISNGIPSFFFYRKTLAEQELELRVKRTLAKVKRSIENGKSKRAIARRIDRLINKYSAK